MDGRGKITSVRFGQAEWELVARQAQENGVTASQFIRDAALGRAIWRLARNSDVDLEEELVKQVRRLQDELAA